MTLATQAYDVPSSPPAALREARSEDPADISEHVSRWMGAVPVYPSHSKPVFFGLSVSQTFSRHDTHSKVIIFVGTLR